MDLVTADRHAEVLAGDIFNLMRFIENDGCVFGNDGPELFFLQREVRKKEVMVHDDDVALGGALVHLRQKAALELLAFLAAAEIASGVNLGPG